MFLPNFIDYINQRILSLHKSEFSLSNTQDGVLFKFTLRKQDILFDEFE